MKHDRGIIFKEISKIAFLSGVKGRLENDVRPYFGCIEQASRERHIGIGFWAVARMIFPVIEAVASGIYGEPDRKKNTVKLLTELGVPCPNLAWVMYRHSLIHGDQPRCVRYGRERVVWEMRVGGGHECKHLRLAIDVRKIYDDFISFLDREIAESPDRTIRVEDEVEFNDKAPAELKRELEVLSAWARSGDTTLAPLIQGGSVPGPRGQGEG